MAWDTCHARHVPQAVDEDGHVVEHRHHRVEGHGEALPHAELHETAQLLVREPVAGGVDCREHAREEALGLRGAAAGALHVLLGKVEDLGDEPLGGGVVPRAVRPQVPVQLVVQRHGVVRRQRHAQLECVQQHAEEERPARGGRMHDARALLRRQRKALLPTIARGAAP